MWRWNIRKWSDQLVIKNKPLRLTLVGVGGDGAEYLGRFGDALQDTIETYTVNDEVIRLDDFLGRLDGHLPPDGMVFPFRRDNRLILPRQRLIDIQLTAPVEVYPDLVELLKSLPPDERSHFIPKAQGAEHGELTWYFEGRAHRKKQNLHLAPP